MAKFMSFNFRCKDSACDHVFTDLVKPDVRTASCPECGHEAKRLIGAPTLDPKLESRHNIWVKQNRQKIAQDKKFYKEHGVDKKHHSYGS